MEKIILNPAIKVGAGRYRQGTDVLDSCGEEILRFGKKVFIMARNHTWNAVRTEFSQDLKSFQIIRGVTTLENAMNTENVKTNMKTTAEQVFRLL